MRLRKAMDFAGRVAIVTGASSGIGLAVTRALIDKGARVAMVARSRTRLEELTASLGPTRAVAFPVDVRDRSELVKLPGRVVEGHGRLDFLVHSAGVNHRGAVSDRSIDELAEILDVNLAAPVLLTRAALPFLKAGAAIVNVASLAGKVPIPHEAAYCASKAGLRAFGRALGLELRRHGVTVCTVCPGPVDTAFLGDLGGIPDIVLSQPMSSATGVAETVLTALDAGLAEVDIPKLSGKLATLGYLAPKALAMMRPVLERRGARNRRRLLARRRGSS